MQSINLSKDIISENDTIRMSITTLPDEQRQVQTINIRELKHKHPVFKIKMNDKIERFIVVFRRRRNYFRIFWTWPLFLFLLLSHFYRICHFSRPATLEIHKRFLLLLFFNFLLVLVIRQRRHDFFFWNLSHRF